MGAAPCRVTARGGGVRAVAMTTLSPARAAMRALHRAPEPEVLAGLLPAATLDETARARVVGRALGLLADLRAAQSSGWVNRFLQQYRLNTAEGIALLSLAEAFLRVPDPATADLLIRDKIGGADWGAHAGKSDFGLGEFSDLGAGADARGRRRRFRFGSQALDRAVG